MFWYFINMKSQNDKTLKELMPYIPGDIKEPQETVDAVIYKITDVIHHMHTVTVEPGVEIARSLSIYIDTLINGSVRLGFDLSVIVIGILVGTFRSNRSIRQEAHKTIRLLVNEVLQSVFKYNGDAKKAVDGLLSAIVIIAKEQKLNTREALIVTVEDILSSAKKIDSEFAERIRISIPKEYDGLRIEGS